MKAFRFNLERILRLRAHREREWELRLAEVTGTCIQLRRRIDQAYRFKAEELSTRFSRGTDIAELAASDRYVDRLDQETSRNEAALRREEERRESVQAAFLEAQRERKVLEKLKERRAEEHRREQRLEEIALTDDMNSGRAVRRRAGGAHDG